MTDPKRKAIVLKDKWTTNATDVPEPRAIEMTEVVPGTYMDAPFPIKLDAQKRLLELIYSRKSGIITRQELIEILFSPGAVPKGTIIKSLI